MGQHISNMAKLWSSQDKQDQINTNSTLTSENEIKEKNDMIDEKSQNITQEDSIQDLPQNIDLDLGVDEKILNATNDVPSQILNETEIMEPEFDLALQSESEDIAPQFQLNGQYMKDRGIIISQTVIFLLLILLKYVLFCCGFKMKGTQSKLLGSLLITQSILMNKNVHYDKIWLDFDMKTILESMIIGTLFVLALFHLIRLNHFVPQSWKGEYQQIAQRVLDQNAAMLEYENSQTDVIYENKFEDDNYYIQQYETGFFDSCFTVCDFVVQLSVFVISLLNILTKEGFIDVLAPNSGFYSTLKNLGLNKNLSLIAIFSMVHINQSKYTGLSKLDSFQYFMIRALPIFIQVLIIIKSDYNGTLKYHFEQLLLTLFYAIYLIINDYSNSRANQLAMYFDSDYLDEGSNPLGYSAEHAERRQHRVVLLMYRPDGRGGIQGIIMDSFYMNKDGRIANEFWVITDSELGEIKQISSYELYKIQDGTTIQKAFKDYFLKAKQQEETTDLGKVEWLKTQTSSEQTQQPAQTPATQPIPNENQEIKQ